MIESCKICGNQLDGEEIVKNLDRHGLCVCDRCAMRVANAYEHWHGGYEINQARECQEKREPLSGDVRWKIFKRDGYACVRCGSDSDLTIDHITPRSRGGSDEESNLQTMCRSCNSAKGARPLEEMIY